VPARRECGGSDLGLLRLHVERLGRTFRRMRLRIFCLVVAAMWIWVVPVAHTMPIDADGPSGLSDNGDFDDVILSVTSPTLAVAAACVQAPPSGQIHPGGTVLPPTDCPRQFTRPLSPGRAPPLV
jgi:hypothetical protein